MMSQWAIRSSSGRNTVTGTFQEQWRDASGQELLLVNLDIEGQFWKRWSVTQEDPANLVVDFSVSVSQLIFQKERVQILIEKLNTWIQELTPFAIELAGSSGDDQSLFVEIGRSDQLIYSQEKPACIISYKAGVFQAGRWAYIVDQTCISALVDELNTALNELAKRGRADEAKP
jgi:hypothetical protein